MTKKQSDLILARIREMRDVLDLTPEWVAQKIGVSRDEYLAYENGTTTLPISTLYDLADVFQIDVTILLTGEPPRMEAYTVVRAGEGTKVDRYPGYQFESLAANFMHRTMEPMLVEVLPETPVGEKAARVTHHGQEFNWVMEGSVRIELGRHSFVLNKGDSIYFDAKTPHRQLAEGGPATFLTIIQN